MENLPTAGQALETAGQLAHATPERQWADEVIEHLMTARAGDTVCDSGDWYTYPAPFPGSAGTSKDLFEVLSSAVSSGSDRAYANYVLQHDAGPYSSDFTDLLFRNPRAAAGGGPTSRLTRQVVYLRPDLVVVHDRATTPFSRSIVARELHHTRFRGPCPRRRTRPRGARSGWANDVPTSGRRSGLRARSQLKYRGFACCRPKPMKEIHHPLPGVWCIGINA